MRLYLLRHGHALSASEAGVASDYDRPLSRIGQDDVRKMTLRLASRGARPAIILHSPLKRAVETAALAVEVLKPPRGMEAFPPLANELSAHELAMELKRRGNGSEQILAIGHQPQIGQLITLLSGAAFNLRPGGAVTLELKTEGPATFLDGCNPEEL